MTTKPEPVGLCHNRQQWGSGVAEHLCFGGRRGEDEGGAAVNVVRGCSVQSKYSHTFEQRTSQDVFITEMLSLTLGYELSML